MRVEVSGSTGRVLVGYELAATFTSWKLARGGEDTPLASQDAKGEGVVSWAHWLWATQPASRIEFYLGSKHGVKVWWFWNNPLVTIKGTEVWFIVTGDPVIQLEGTDHDVKNALYHSRDDEAGTFGWALDRGQDVVEHG